MSQINLPSFTGSRSRTRTYDFDNDPSFIISAVAKLICPPGTIVPVLTATDPGNGWKLCNGQYLTKQAYPRLYEVIGGAFGETDQAFALPDLRGRMPIGADGEPGIAPLAFGGAASISLTVDQMPAHAHDITDPGHDHTFTGTPHNHAVTDPGHAHAAASVAAGTGAAGTVANGGQAGATGSAATGVTVEPSTAGGTISPSPSGITVQSAGSGAPIPTLPPYIAIHWMVRT